MLQKKTSGLDKAQPVAPVTSKSKGILVKPNPIQVSFVAPCTWVMGESSKGSRLRSSGVFESPMIAVVPKPERCDSVLITDPLPVTQVVTSSVR